MNELTIRRPDDWHLHLRDGAVLDAVLPWTANLYGRAIVMPNLKPPITTVAAARHYRELIIKALPEGSTFQPLMTCYLTDTLAPSEIKTGKEDGVFTAAKLYPAGATTNSDLGVTDIKKIYPVFEMMQQVDLPLLIHGEVVDPEVDIFDRETVYLERVLQPILRDFPELRVVSEHITTEDAAHFIAEQSDRVGATITTYHLMVNRNSIFSKGIRPHMFCMPVAKREKDRVALVHAATSGDSHFFLGTDSAPHLTHLKEHANGAAGIFSSPNTLECLAELFEAEGALDQLENFISINGPRFYKLPVNEETVTLERGVPVVPSEIEVEPLGATIQVFESPVALNWRVKQTI